MTRKREGFWSISCFALFLLVIENSGTRGTKRVSVEHRQKGNHECDGHEDKRERKCHSNRLPVHRGSRKRFAILVSRVIVFVIVAVIFRFENGEFGLVSEFSSLFVIPVILSVRNASFEIGVQSFPGFEQTLVFFSILLLAEVERPLQTLIGGSSVRASQNFTDCFCSFASSVVTHLEMSRVFFRREFSLRGFVFIVCRERETEKTGRTFWKMGFGSKPATQRRKQRSIPKSPQRKR